MKNPYEILGIKQDATNSEVVRAQMTALRSRKYSQREIAEAQATLRKPALRLAADFTFPIFPNEQIKPLVSAIKSRDITWDSIDENKYDSLNK